MPKQSFTALGQLRLAAGNNREYKAAFVKAGRIRQGDRSLSAISMRDMRPFLLKPARADAGVRPYSAGSGTGLISESGQTHATRVGTGPRPCPQPSRATHGSSFSNNRGRTRQTPVQHRFRHGLGCRNVVASTSVGYRVLSVSTAG